MKVAEAVAGGGEGLFLSLAARPGTMGTRVYNAAFQQLGLPYRYLACRSSKETFIDDVYLAKDRGVRGISVSMPLKERAADLARHRVLDAKTTNLANTLLLVGGEIVGFNTDYAALRDLSNRVDTFRERTVIRGDGAMARMADRAFATWANQPVMRDRATWATFEKNGWQDDAQVVINATPLGMAGELSIDLDRFIHARLVIDVVIGDTPLVREARRRGLEVVTGLDLYLMQVREQFRIYTGMELPISVARKAAEIAMMDLPPV